MTCSRRDFLKISGLAAAPIMAPRLVFGQSAVATETLVVVFARGGMDGLNVIVPHGDADYYRLRPVIGVPRPGTGTGAALDLDGYFGLHPSLAPLLPLYQAGRLAAVQAAGFLLGSRSHFECQDFMERGALTAQGLATGWLERHLEVTGVNTTFQAVGVGSTLQLALRGPAPAIGLRTIADFTIKTTSSRKAEIEATFSKLYDADALLADSARTSLSAVDSLVAANPAQYPIEAGAVYPATTFGGQMKEVAQLIKAGLGLQIACVDIGGWDHHDAESNALAPLLDELSKSLLAFDTDLGPRMANVTVVTMTEFGRRAGENASAGTDHGSGYGMFLLGGGVLGQRVYRDWPGLSEANLFRGDLAITTDYRTVLSEVLDKRLGGTDLARVFPGFQQRPQLGAFLRR